MPEVQGFSKLLSFVPRKRFGIFCKLGTIQMGFTHYGDDEMYLAYSEYGNTFFGIDVFADIILLSGIYRTDNVTGETKFYREPYYITKNPRYADQQAWRLQYAYAVHAWQTASFGSAIYGVSFFGYLTDAIKAEHNRLARNLHMSGYNHFQKEYLLSQ